MTGAVGVGERVEHPERGAGVVVATLPGRRLRVRFDATPSCPATLPGRELRSAKAPDARSGPNLSTSKQRGAPRAKATAGRASKPSTKGRARAEARDAERAALWQTIEALRLGVVPAAHARDYTVGRDEQLDRLEALLATGQGLRVVSGDYGMGKTHLLDVLEQVAGQRGFVVARVALDPTEVPLSHPLRLYSAVLRSLRYPDGTQGTLEPILEKLEASQRHLSDASGPGSRFFSPVLFARGLGDPDLAELLSDYIAGYHVDSLGADSLLRERGWNGARLLTLSDYRTYGRMYVYLLGTLACWARDAGFGGLLLLFDEAERGDLFDAAHFRLASEVLRHFAAVTLPAGALRFDPEDLYRGGHRVHQELPLRFEAAQPLSVVMALTDAPRMRRELLEMLDPQDVLVRLRHIPMRELATLTDRISALYSAAYPELVLGPDARAALHQGVRRVVAREGELVPRDLVRGMVALLDGLRHGRVSERDLASG